MLALLASLPSRATEMDAATKRDFEVSTSMTFDHAVNEIHAAIKVLASGDCRQVAALTRFPFELNGIGRPSPYIWNRTAFCRYFPTIFTDERRALIANQRLEEMPGAPYGIMINHGTLWLRPVCPGGNDWAYCKEPERKLFLVQANIGPGQ